MEEFGLCQRIVLVRVALRTRHGRSHPNGVGGIHAVNDGHIAKLLIIGSTFVIGQRIAVEGGRNPLTGGRIGKMIAGDLFNGKLVERRLRLKASMT